jgi:hypothetical protein
MFIIRVSVIIDPGTTYADASIISLTYREVRYPQVMIIFVRSVTFVIAEFTPVADVPKGANILFDSSHCNSRRVNSAFY